MLTLRRGVILACCVCEAWRDGCCEKEWKSSVAQAHSVSAVSAANPIFRATMREKCDFYFCPKSKSMSTTNNKKMVIATIILLAWYNLEKSF